MRNVLKPLAKRVLIPLELTATTSAKKIHYFGTTKLIISNDQMEDIIKIVS